MDNQYLDVFIDEAREHLQSMNQNIIDLENDPEDMKTLDSLFRVAHTLKGMAATMGYQGVANYTHKLENVLDSFRQGERKVTSDIIDLLLEGADALEEFVNGLAEGVEKELNFTSMQERLEEAFKKTEETGTAESGPVEESKSKTEESYDQAQSKEGTDGEAEASSAKPSGTPEISDEQRTLKSADDLNEYEYNLVNSALSEGYGVYYLKVNFEESVLLKGARAFMVFQQVEDKGEIIKSVPDVESIEDEEFEHFIELVTVTQEEKSALKEDIENISEIENVEIEDFDIAQTSQKDRGEKAESTGAQAQAQAESEAQKAEAPKTGAATAAAAEKGVDTEAEAKPQKDDAKDSQQKAKTGKTVRVDIERLDKLMNLVSELVINKTRLERVANTNESSDLVKTSEQFSRITSEIQNVVMKVRMVPLEQVFNRFPRMVRDLSRSMNKEINLVIEGKETELDRSLIDEIGDLLMHLIRNAIDHGLEEPETREKLGKSTQGTIHIKAYHNENNVVIEVIDDGKGIDPDKVREKALSKGLIDSQQSSQIPDSEIIHYLFTPGFSTSDEVSEVSGRGVGLDVVKDKLENLGGRVELESEINQGSKFTMYLPLTLAIIQALMVNVGNEQYALPLSSIEETTILTDDDINKVQEQEVIRLRENLVPIVDLHHILGLNGWERSKAKEQFAIIVSKGDRKAGLIVDELLGQQEVVIKSLGSFLSDLKGFTGATILGDGTVALILDINSLFSGKGGN